MTARRNNRMAARARQEAYAVALERPELRRPSDGFARSAPASPCSAPIKVRDAGTDAMVKAFLERRVAPR